MGAVILVESDTQPTVVIKIVPFLPGGAVILSESHNKTASVAEHVVEDGPAVADNIRLGTTGLSLEAFVTMTPTTRDPLTGNGGTRSFPLDLPSPYSGDAIPPPATPGYVTRGATNLIAGRVFDQISWVTVLAFDRVVNPPRSAWESLNEIMDNKTRVRVITTLAEYTDMVLINLGASKTPEEGSGIRIGMDFQKIRTASTSLVSAPVPKTERGKGKTNVGARATKEEEEGGDGQLKSAAAKLFDGGTAALESYGIL